jgi:surfactin synthase thioesterase subunit
MHNFSMHACMKHVLYNLYSMKALPAPVPTRHLLLPQALPGETRRTDSLAVTLTLLQQLLFEVLPAIGGWRPDQIQLLGFSQGACVSMELARVLCQAGRQPLGG